MAKVKKRFPTPAELKILTAISSSNSGVYAMQLVTCGAAAQGSIYTLLTRLKGLGYVTETRPRRSQVDYPGMIRPIYMVTEAGKKAIALHRELW